LPIRTSYSPERIFTKRISLHQKQRPGEESDNNFLILFGGKDISATFAHSLAKTTKQ
jgi:hypothetical protein